MSSWAICAICAVILIGSVLAADTTRQVQRELPVPDDTKIVTPLLKSPPGALYGGLAADTTRQVQRELPVPDDTKIVAPVLKSSSGALYDGGGQASEGEMNETIKVKDIREALNNRIEPDKPLVHDEALLIVAKFSSPEDSTIDQISSIYSYLKNGYGPIKGWIYVNDPRGLDYFNYANESLTIGDKSGCAGAGDCDDFAVLMASLVESIGGTSRIILAYDISTGGHAYTEVYLGNLNSRDNQINDTIVHLKEKYNTNEIFTYNDTDTKDVWLNLDWGPDEKGNAHPGGPFCRGDNRIVLAVRDKFGKTPLLLLPSNKKVVLQSPAITLNITKNETESNSSRVWYNKGVALYDLGKINEAVQAYNRAIQLDPRYVAAWNNKGNALSDQGKYGEAIQAYDKAIEIDPQYASAWSNKGNAFKKLGLTAESKEAFDKAKELESEGSTGKPMPETTTVSLRQMTASDWFDKGLALSSQGKYDEAIQAFDKAIELDPQYANAWYNKAFALTRLGLTAESKEAFDKAKELGTKADQ
jgi:tetratricopeptide (TPR) repeat protein